MARERKPERDKARQIWIDSGGTMNARELAEKVGVKPEQIRKWKSLDNWTVALEESKQPRKRGGQPGNKNAAGAGAPPKNKNAQTHGAYSTVLLTDLPQEQREYIESITLNTETNMLTQLQLLLAKEVDLQAKIESIEHADPAALYVDRVVEMRVPRDDGAHSAADKQEDDKIKMKSVIRASAFERTMKLEAQLNKIHGRIIKLLDSIKAYQTESRRIHLEERKYHLAKQKLSGVYDIDPESGEIIDQNEDSEDIEALLR